MRASVPLHPMAIASLIILAGCASPILHQTELASFYEKVKEERALAKKFLICTSQAYGGQPAGGSAVVAPRADGTEPPMLAADAVALDAVMIEAPDLKVDQDLQGLLTLVQELADPRRREIDFSSHMKLLARIPQVANRLHARIRFEEDRLAQDGSPFVRLLVAYNKAYFGDLQFNVEPTATKGVIRGVLKVVSAGFVDRNGNAFVFPGLSSEVAISPDKPVRFHADSVDSRRVASDLVRIFVEAFFDSAFRVPAEGRATALQVQWGPTQAAYPKFDAEHPPISLDQFAVVTRAALRAEAAATSAVGKAVRGGGVFGINNETVASGVETAAGVIAKKLVEHEAFCYFLVRSGERRAEGPEPISAGQAVAETVPLQ